MSEGVEYTELEKLCSSLNISKILCDTTEEVKIFPKTLTKDLRDVILFIESRIPYANEVESRMLSKFLMYEETITGSKIMKLDSMVTKKESEGRPEPANKLEVARTRSNIVLRDINNSITILQEQVKFNSIPEKIGNEFIKELALGAEKLKLAVETESVTNMDIQITSLRDSLKKIAEIMFTAVESIKSKQ